LVFKSKLIPNKIAFLKINIAQLCVTLRNLCATPGFQTSKAQQSAEIHDFEICFTFNLPPLRSASQKGTKVSRGVQRSVPLSFFLPDLKHFKI